MVLKLLNAGEGMLATVERVRVEVWKIAYSTGKEVQERGRAR